MRLISQISISFHMILNNLVWSFATSLKRRRANARKLFLVFSRNLAHINQASSSFHHKQWSFLLLLWCTTRRTLVHNVQCTTSKHTRYRATILQFRLPKSGLNLTLSCAQYTTYSHRSYHATILRYLMYNVQRTVPTRTRSIIVQYLEYGTVYDVQYSVRRTVPTCYRSTTSLWYYSYVPIYLQLRRMRVPPSFKPKASPRGLAQYLIPRPSTTQQYPSLQQ